MLDILNIKINPDKRNIEFFEKHLDKLVNEESSVEEILRFDSLVRDLKKGFA